MDEGDSARTITGVTRVGNGGEVTFRRATVDRIADVLGVLDEAAGWLHARGVVDQWPSRFEAARVADAVSRGETWLVGVAGRVAGTVTLDRSDPLWADVGGTAGYVHRLAVRRWASGLGALVLDWASDRARWHGVEALRLDCVRANARLRAYYVARGFTHRGDAPWGVPGQRRDGATVSWHSRYERAVTPGR